jgi:hypothetical protein
VFGGGVRENLLTGPRFDAAAVIPAAAQHVQTRGAREGGRAVLAAARRRAAAEGVWNMLPRRSSGLGLALVPLLATGASGSDTGASGSERPAPDLTREPTLYVVGYAHLDTQWRWTYPQVIREMIPATMLPPVPALSRLHLQLQRRQPLSHDEGVLSRGVRLVEALCRGRPLGRSRHLQCGNGGDACEVATGGEEKAVVGNRRLCDLAIHRGGRDPAGGAPALQSSRVHEHATIELE